MKGLWHIFQATGKDKLLKAAERFADYVAANFGTEEGKLHGYPGHEIAEMALVRLYELTGKEKYLNLARYFVDERGKRPYYFDQEHPEEVKKGHEDELRYFYNQAHLPVRKQDEAFGHSVRAVYLYSGMADVARLTGEEALYGACRRLWDNITEKKMYVTGGIGSTHLGEAFTYAYDLPNDTAYAETCASIGLVFFARRMLEIAPEARYANVMERALYNGVLSGMALDGKSFFYVNPLEVLPEACHRMNENFMSSRFARNGSAAHAARQIWRVCSARSVPMHIRKTRIRCFTSLYGKHPGKEDRRKDSRYPCGINFPWEGDVKITIRAKDTGLKLALRIPDWCSRYELDGFTGGTEEKDGYLYLQKDWGEEEEFTLHFPMEVRMIAAKEAVREDMGKVAVMRGPVVYCLEETDNGKRSAEAAD